MISDERMAEMRKYFLDETNDEEDELWRFELTDEERRLVGIWDGEYVKTLGVLSKNIVELE